MAPIRHPRTHPRYRIHFEDIGHPATAAFLQIPSVARILENASNEVFKYLYDDFGTPVAVRSVTMKLCSVDGVAFTGGIDLDFLHKEMTVSLGYISNYIDDPERFNEECVGVITHEMVHCWQHNAQGTAPGGLIEGIADFVRLKAGLAPPHWKRTKDELGTHWDEGYQKTAFFLDWLEEMYGKGTVGRINNALEGKPYHEQEFWYDLFGSSVDSLWKAYLEAWEEKDREIPQSVASSEPEVVDLAQDEMAASLAELNGEPKQARSTED